MRDIMPAEHYVAGFSNVAVSSEQGQGGDQQELCGGITTISHQRLAGGYPINHPEIPQLNFTNRPDLPG
jgi:hypothetical protein